MAGIHEDLGRGVVELRRAHRPHDGDVVHDLRQIGQQLGDLGAGPTVLGELERRRQQFRRAFDEGKALTLDQLLRNLLSIVLRERRLRIE